MPIFRLMNRAELIGNSCGPGIGKKNNMVFEKNNFENQAGFLTAEIMLALAVMVCAITAAGLMAFSGQTMASDSELDFQAVDLAQKMLEDQRILASDDFRLVNSTTTKEGIFNGRVDVAPQSFFVKSVDAVVDWDISGRSRQTRISALIADYNATAGDDTCDSNLTGDWTNPQIEKVIDFSQFTESASSTYAIGDIDVYKNKLYVGMEKTGTKTDSTFFVFDIANPVAPLLINRIDNNAAAMAGINAIAVNKAYAYVASATTKQFQIIDVSKNPLKIFSHKINNGEEAQSVFYKNGYVYLGLTKASGPEFNIINAQDPNDPVVMGFEIDSAVNDIYVKGDYAYLAHPANLASGIESGREQLTILNVADPANPYRVGGYYHDESLGGNGKSLYSISNKIYLGRTTSHISGAPDTISDFFVFDNPNPGTADVLVLGSQAFSRVGSANGVLVREKFAFVLLGTESQGGDLRILNIADPANIIEKKIVDLPSGANGVGGAAMDCEGNYLYVASVDGAGKSYISVITAR